MMELTILGSGTAAPLLDRSCAGYLLEVDNKKLLLDSGAGTIRRLLELKVNLFDISHVFYTHLHNDHVNDLGALIWCYNYGGIRKNPLNLYGPLGLKKYYNILLHKLLKIPKLNFKINIKELKNSKLNIGNVTIRTHSIKHSTITKSVAYRIENNGKSIVYTGDTEYSKEVINITGNANILLIECSLPDDKKVEGHLTPSLAGKIAAQSNVKTLILTHFYPEVLRTDIKRDCRKEFNGKIILAKDKMKVTV